MEGVGSTRVGRTSARFDSPAVFNGPVRKWKKKWVYVSPSSTVKHSKNNNSNSSASNSILLCRWTPLSTADSVSFDSAIDGEDDEQPPKRKFRYTPVAVLEEEHKRAAARQVEDKAKRDENETNHCPDWLSSKHDGKLSMDKDLKKETQDSSIGSLDLGLCLKGHDSGHDGSHDSVGEKEGQEKAASSVGFCRMA